GQPGVCIDVAMCRQIATPGFCPGAANIQCCHGPAPDAGAFMCNPSDSPEPNAGITEEPGVGGCPSGMLRVDTFCVDRFEGSLVQVNADGTTSPWSPFHNPGTTRVRAVSLRGAVPQGYISGVQAGAACMEAGKRLCTDQEWLRAC